MTRKWETDLDCELGRGTLKIEYEFDPGESRVDNYGDGTGYPGTEPSVTIIGTPVFIIEEPDMDVFEGIQNKIKDEECDGEDPNLE
jgi:hypothetical protein